MKLSNLGLRKAAVLVASLDQAAADALLEQLTPEQSRQVRQLVVDLGDVDQQEQHRVIEEFFRVGPLLPAQCPPGIELDDGLARRLSLRQATADAYQPASAPLKESQPFRFLREAEADKLVRVLDGERPQTIALVLSHLPPQQAGSVLARLPGALQTEVVRRLVDLEETDAEILREVEETLQARLSEQVELQRRRVAGLAAVAGILQAADGRTGMQILDNLATHDRALAERLGSRPLAFDDLADSRRPRVGRGDENGRAEPALHRPDRRGAEIGRANHRPAFGGRSRAGAAATRSSRTDSTPRRGRGAGADRPARAA